MSDSEANAGEVTRILSAIQNGNAQAAKELLPLVYDELRNLAAAKMSHEQPDVLIAFNLIMRELAIKSISQNFSYFFPGGCAYRIE